MFFFYLKEKEIAFKHIFLKGFEFVETWIPSDAICKYLLNHAYRVPDIEPKNYPSVHLKEKVHVLNLRPKV